MTCLHGHVRVVASASCAHCHQPLQAAGRLDHVGDEPLWLAPPFLDLRAARCPATGGRHHVADGHGVCCGCSAEVGAEGDERGKVWWVWE